MWKVMSAKRTSWVQKRCVVCKGCYSDQKKNWKQCCRSPNIYVLKGISIHSGNKGSNQSCVQILYRNFRSHELLTLHQDIKFIHLALHLCCKLVSMMFCGSMYSRSESSVLSLCFNQIYSSYYLSLRRKTVSRLNPDSMYCYSWAFQKSLHNRLLFILLQLNGRLILVLLIFISKKPKNIIAEFNVFIFWIHWIHSVCGRCFRPEGLTRR